MKATNRTISNQLKSCIFLFGFIFINTNTCFSSIPGFNRGYVNISNDVKILLDSSYALNIKDITAADSNNFKQSDEDYIKLNINPAAIWIKILVTPSEKANNRYLQISNAVLNKIYFYVPTDSGNYIESTSGIKTLFYNRPLKTRLPTFKLPNTSKPIFCYLRIESEIDKNFMLKVMPEFHLYQSDKIALLGIYSVILLLLLSILGAILHYLMYRHNLALIFIGLNVVTILITLFYTGLLQQIPILHSLLPKKRVLQLMLPLLALFEIFFIKSYFQLEKHFDYIWKLLKIVVFVLLLFIPISFFIPTIYIMGVNGMISLFIWSVMIYLAFQELKSINKATLFFRSGLVTYCLFGLLFFFTNFFGLPIYKFINPDYLFPITALVIKNILFGVGGLYVVREFLYEKELMTHQILSFQSEIDQLKNRVFQLLTEPEEEQQTITALKNKNEKNAEIDLEHNISALARLNQRLPEPLTKREFEVLEIIALGLTNKQIAEKLFISPNTVKTHTIKIYEKLDVGNRTQAVSKLNKI